MSAFPVGAWVRDAEAARLTGGIERGRFRPTFGEIVSIGTLAGREAYTVRYAANDAIIFADAAECSHCGAPDDDSHPLCVGRPDGALRNVEHTPGWGDYDMDAVTRYEAAQRAS